MSPEVPDSKPKPTKLPTHPEDLARAFAASVNSRELQDDNPLYSLVDPNFEAIPGPPLPPTPISWSKYIAGMRQIVKDKPDYMAYVKDISSEINEITNVAQVFMNIEVSGLHPGVVRRAVVIFRCRRTGGIWRVSGYQTMHGIEGTEAR